MQCEKCAKHLNDCQSCKGRGGGSNIFGHMNCGTCKNTGLVCNSHGGNWQR